MKVTEVVVRDGARRLSHALGLVFNAQPQRFVYSAFLGGLLHLPVSLAGIDIGYLYFFCFAFLALNYKTLRSLFASEQDQTDSVLRAINMIERARIAGAREEDVQRLYLMLCKQLIAEAQIEISAPAEQAKRSLGN